MDDFPFVALFLAVSFALYGFVRRRVGVPSFVGLTVETLILLPFALGYFVWQWLSPTGLPDHTPPEFALLALGGAVTIFPLLCFAYAALHVPFTILGFIQYLAPSLTLTLAVTVYGQTVTAERWQTFAFIWTAVALFSFESLYHGWRNARATKQVTEDAAGR